MRKYGTDAPRFLCFQVEGSDEVYKIPLAASMTNREIVDFEKTGGRYRDQVEWLRGYVGDIVDDMTREDTINLLNEWLNATEEQGASVGE